LAALCEVKLRNPILCHSFPPLLNIPNLAQ
jgi:hypothetical protein